MSSTTMKTGPCQRCGRVMRLPAKGLCNGCYRRPDTDAECVGCGEVKRIYAKSRCATCYRALDARSLARKQAGDRAYYWLTRFKLTAEGYARLLEEQGGGCGVCHQPCSTGRMLAVDHDHSCCPTTPTCGKCTRGLLCANCNNAAGRLKDDVTRAEALVAYLRHWS